MCDGWNTDHSCWQPKISTIYVVRELLGLEGQTSTGYDWERAVKVIEYNRVQPNNTNSKHHRKWFKKCLFIRGDHIKSVFACHIHFINTVYFTFTIENCSFKFCHTWNSVDLILKKLRKNWCQLKRGEREGKSFCGTSTWGKSQYCLTSLVNDFYNTEQHAPLFWHLNWASHCYGIVSLGRLIESKAMCWCCGGHVCL